MTVKNARFNLFMRQWLRGESHCTEVDIDEAISKGILTFDEGQEIKNTERN